MVTASQQMSLGPKGVINDWRKYKQLEVEQKQEQKREMERLIKKLSMTCRSDLDLEKDKEQEAQLQNKLKGKVSLLRCADFSLCILLLFASVNCFCSLNVCVRIHIQQRVQLCPHR